ncbi:hypothetical protein [Cupriavidus sp. Marseille-Q8015]
MAALAAESVDSRSPEKAPLVQTLAASSGYDGGELRRNAGAAAFGTAGRLVQDAIRAAHELMAVGAFEENRRADAVPFGRVTDEALQLGCGMKAGKGGYCAG